MPHALTLPAILAVSIVGATATGIGLGRSAIAEINPAKYGDPGETQFYGDMAPNRRADWGAVSAEEYKQQASAAPPAAASPGGCVGCATFPMAPRPVHDPAVERALSDAWREARAPAPPVRYVETVVYEQPRADPAFERVRRYASYPVTRDQAAPPPPPPREQGAADADEGDAATQ